MRVLCLSLQDDRYYVLLLLRCSIYLVHVNSRPLYRFQFLFWSVVRGSEKTPEKVEIASVKPVSATMKPITATKPASTTTSAATTTATSIAVKRKGDTPSTPHSKRARKDGREKFKPLISPIVWNGLGRIGRIGSVSIFPTRPRFLRWSAIIPDK